MIEFEEASEIVRNLVFKTKSEKVHLDKALNRVIRENIYIPHDVPRFNRSAMDGYACKKTDLTKKLRIVEEIPAGKSPVKFIKENECARTMTGAKVPEGADIVVEQELTSIGTDGSIVVTQAPKKDNIQKQGEDMKAGELLLEKGTFLKPWHIAMIATAGISELAVSAKPKVLVAATGSELTEPGNPVSESGIYNSNAYQMIAQLELMGVNAKYGGIVKDNQKEVKKLLETSETYDLVLLSGGVSVGDYDYIPETLKELGYKIHFHGLKVKPGKHTLLAQNKNGFAIGLPGNPVSSLLQFEVLVKPFLMHIMGSADDRQLLLLESAEQLLTKPARRMTLIPVIIKNDKVYSIKYNGSAHIHAFARANAIAVIPLGKNEINKGDKINVRPI